MNTETALTQSEPTEYAGRATYSPEDNKLRLYVGRVPRDEFLKLRAEGWVTLHKQREAGGGDFAATWTPERRDTALAYAGIIEDEDMGPEERAADRAERFGAYRDKRADEAGAHADRFDAGPRAHGFQSQARAERAAARHDRVADRACDAWSRAEYWQRRTAGVIAHRLHLSSPGVRMGRIKELEAEIRKCEKARAEYFDKFARWVVCSEMTDPEEQTKRAQTLAYVEHGDYTHPRTGRKSYLYDHARREEGRNSDPLTGGELCALWLATNPKPQIEEGDWLTHYRLRLAYETQMLEAQGGRAAFVEMQVGGWIGAHQIRKVNKSPETGRVVSVTLKQRGTRWDPRAPGWCLIPYNVERLPADAYRAPTPEDLAALEAEKAAEKAAQPKKETIPLVNPTDADADRLQEIWNRQNACVLAQWQAGQPAPTVARITQAQYSANSSGTFAKCETVEITGGGFQRKAAGLMDRPDCRTVAKVRKVGYRVIVITDKPQKAFAPNVWHDPRPAIVEELSQPENFATLSAALRVDWLDRMTEEGRALVDKARIVGLAQISSMSQFGFTETGHAWARSIRNAQAVTA